MVAVATLPLVSLLVPFWFPDPPRCPLNAHPQIDVDSLFELNCLPSVGEYRLGALLLAAQLGGDVENIKLWVRDCQENPVS